MTALDEAIAAQHRAYVCLTNTELSDEPIRVKVVPAGDKVHVHVGTAYLCLDPVTAHALALGLTAAEES